MFSLCLLCKISYLNYMNSHERLPYSSSKPKALLFTGMCNQLQEELPEQVLSCQNGCIVLFQKSPQALELSCFVLCFKNTLKMKNFHNFLHCNRLEYQLWNQLFNACCHIFLSFTFSKNPTFRKGLLTWIQVYLNHV